MSEFKFKLNSAGVRQLLQSSEMQNILNKQASGVQSRAGEGFAFETRVGAKRAYASVYPDTQEAYYRNLKRNILLKAMK